MPDPDGSLLFLRTPRSLRRALVNRYFREIHREVLGGRPVTCLVTDDRELRRLNRTFLGKDYPTDVLSFPAAPAPGAPHPNGFLGEIAVSAARAQAQAADFGHSVEEEIAILLLHGALHLLGMDHERDSGAMKRAETRWRRRLGLPACLTERTPR